MKLALLDSIKGLVKNTKTTKEALIKAGKRHHYYNKVFDLNSKLTRPRNTYDLFKMFMDDVIPNFEDNIELLLLKKQLSATNDPALRESILKAYETRRMDILVQKSRWPSLDRSPPEIASTYKKEPKDIFSKVSLLNQGEEDIGYYTEFSSADISEYFPLKMNGNYFELEFMRTRRFSLFRTEEVSKLIADFSKIIPSKLLNIDYEGILNSCETSADIKEYLNDEELYPRIFQHFSITFIDCLRPHRANVYFERVFRISPIFDAIVNSMIRLCEDREFLNMFRIRENREIVFNAIINYIEDKGDRLETNVQEVKEFFFKLGTFFVTVNGQEYKIPFRNHSQKPRKLPVLMRNYRLKNFFGFNSGGLIHGDFGVGKSGNLLYLAMWAHKSDWFVINVPSAKEWTHKHATIRRHHKTGLFCTFELSQQFLKTLKVSNFDLLATTPVNMSLYGKFGTSGVHENDPNPTPNTYYADRKTYWKDHEKFISEKEWEMFENEDNELRLETLAFRLPDPHSLLDIVEAGISNQLLSICAIYEILEQLYNIEDRNVLVLVDDVNYFYRPSGFKSFRYDNEKLNRTGGIPPYHLALCRAFMHFDGHLIKNGVKVMAPGFDSERFHKFTLKDMFWPKGYDIPAPRLPLDDYRNVMEYYNQNNFLIGKCSDLESEFWWMQTDGNWKHTHDLLKDYSSLVDYGQ